MDCVIRRKLLLSLVHLSRIRRDELPTHQATATGCLEGGYDCPCPRILRKFCTSISISILWPLVLIACWIPSTATPTGRTGRQAGGLLKNNSKYPQRRAKHNEMGNIPTCILSMGICVSVASMSMQKVSQDVLYRYDTPVSLSSVDNYNQVTRDLILKQAKNLAQQEGMVAIAAVHDFSIRFPPWEQLHHSVSSYQRECVA